jgi:hypothetical protein
MVGLAELKTSSISFTFDCHTFEIINIILPAVFGLFNKPLPGSG